MPRSKIKAKKLKVYNMFLEFHDENFDYAHGGRIQYRGPFLTAIRQRL